MLTTLASVPEITELTPEMSVFMRVMMSPCFSVVKKEWGMCCRWSYIWFFMSKMMCWLIQALRYAVSTDTSCDASSVTSAASSSWISSFMLSPTSASSTMRPVMMLGSSPSPAESRMVMNTSTNCFQYGARYPRIRFTSAHVTVGRFCFSASVRKPRGPMRCIESLL